MVSTDVKQRIEKKSHTLSEQIGKWVLLMWGVRTLGWATITGNTIKLKNCIPMWPTVT